MKLNKILIAGLLATNFITKSTIGDFIDDVVSVPVVATERTANWVENSITPVEETRIVIKKDISLNYNADIISIKESIKNRLSSEISLLTIMSVIHDLTQLAETIHLDSVAHNLSVRYKAKSNKAYIKSIKRALDQVAASSEQNISYQSDIVECFNRIQEKLNIK